MTPELKEQFLVALAEQKTLDDHAKALAQRVGQLVRALRETGDNDRILLELDGEVWTVERPEAAVHPNKFWSFRFKKEGKLA
jgi:membrane protein implicated in regulation of membrane protease activity